MSETKNFPIRDLLSVTTGRLICRRDDEEGNGIGHMYKLLGWMTGEPPYTHQLPRFSDECEPWLNRWFPELAGVADEIVTACQTKNEAVMWRAVRDVEKRLGGTRDVPRIPPDDHTFKDAVDELTEIVGKDKVIVIDLNDGGEQ